MNNWAKSVDAEIANTEVNHLNNINGHRNAYQMNLVREYNSGKSARDLLKRSKCTLNLNEKYVSSVVRQEKSEGCCAQDATQGLATSNIPFLAYNRLSSTYESLRSKDKKPCDNKLKYIPVPLTYGTPQGRSATFSNALNNQTQVYNASFFVYRVKNYGIASIENELIEATKSDAGAFVDEVKLNVDTSFRNVSNDLAHDLFGNASGSRGVYSAISTGLITLVNANDIVNFEVGMSLVSFSISGSTYTQSTGAAIGYVIAVNRSLGQLTVSATPGGAAGTPTNWSTSFPNLGVQGDVAFGAIAASTSFLKVSGLGAWLPTVAPTSGDNFWNVDRSADVTRLAGVRFDGSGETIEEALIDGAALVAREGGQPEMCFMSYASYSALEKSLGAKVQYVDVKHEEADIAFAGLRIHAPYGPITVIPDRSCPSQTAYLLQMDVWKLRSLNKMPHILTYGMEGLDALRTADQDAMQLRIGYYGNLTCSAPGWNCVISLSA